LATSSVASAQERLIPPQQAIPETTFGMHIHGITDPRPNTGRITSWPAIRFGAWRLLDARVTWRDLEPKKNEFQFSRLDQCVAVAEQHHVKLLLPLVSTPEWASARPNEEIKGTPKGSAAEPASMDDWRKFVRTVVERYRGRIEAYEIWNEPNMKMFWTGSVDQLVALTREAYTIIKEIDPAAMSVLPSATTETGPQYLDSFLQRGGGQYGDVVGYHFYVHANPPEQMAVVADRVKGILQANHVSKPIWCTEAGWDAPKPFPSELEAAYVSRSYLILWASGVTRFYWYAWDNHGWVTLEMTENDNATPKPSAKAFEQIESWLAGAVMRSCNVDGTNTWSCELDRGGRRQWVVWNRDKTVQFKIPTEWHVTSKMPLLQSAQQLSNTTIQIGQIPTLLR
jgi:hypothetical protein